MNVLAAGEATGLRDVYVVIRGRFGRIKDKDKDTGKDIIDRNDTGRDPKRFP